MKTDLRTVLSGDSLNAILRIKLRGISITQFNEQYSDKVVSFWYNQKDRRINQKTRKQYEKRTTSKRSREIFDVDMFTADVTDSSSSSSSEDESLGNDSDGSSDED